MRDPRYDKYLRGYRWCSRCLHWYITNARNCIECNNRLRTITKHNKAHYEYARY